MRGQGFVSPVGGIRRRLRVKAAGHRIRWAKVEGYLTITNVAERLNVSTNWIRGKIRHGAVIAMRQASGRYLFPDTERTIEALRKLRAREIRRVDFTRDEFKERGYHHG